MNVKGRVIEIQSGIHCSQERLNIGIDLADRIGVGGTVVQVIRAVVAGAAVAAGIDGCPTGKTIALVSCYDEQSVCRGDPVVGEPGEEIGERSVICLKLLHVALFTRSKRPEREAVAVVCIRDIGST